MVPCQGWLGEAGALWALAIVPASNTPSIAAELVRDSFIPRRVPREISYRCIPKTMVVHINKEIQSEQPDDSIPGSAGGLQWGQGVSLAVA